LTASSVVHIFDICTTAMFVLLKVKNWKLRATVQWPDFHTECDKSWPVGLSLIREENIASLIFFTE
jgi:hypothetical protein